MEVLRSYIVRVYRQESDRVAGVIESVETGEATAFRSSEQLWDTLSRPPLM
jgi:predicted Fe-Mo cluster-binding NifX family protein